MKHKPLDELIEEARSVFYKDGAKHEEIYFNAFFLGWLQQSYISLYDDYTKKNRLKSRNKKQSSS